MAFEGFRVGWFAVFLYVAATALRLARFNILAPKTNDGFMDCLVQPQQCLLRPSSGQSLTLVTSIQFIFRSPCFIAALVNMVLWFVFICGFCMVSLLPL